MQILVHNYGELAPNSRAAWGGAWAPPLAFFKLISVNTNR